jgi:hypothetical protein
MEWYGISFSLCVCPCEPLEEAGNTVLLASAVPDSAGNDNRDRERSWSFGNAGIEQQRNAAGLALLYVGPNARRGGAKQRSE